MTNAYKPQRASVQQCVKRARKQASGGYFSKLDPHKAQRGPARSGLQLDYDKLRDVAARVRWTCELVRQLGGHCLVRAYPGAHP